MIHIFTNIFFSLLHLLILINFIYWLFVCSNHEFEINFILYNTQTHTHTCDKKLLFIHSQQTLHTDGHENWRTDLQITFTIIVVSGHSNTETQKKCTTHSFHSIFFSGCTKYAIYKIILHFLRVHYVCLCEYLKINVGVFAVNC